MNKFRRKNSSSTLIAGAAIALIGVIIILSVMRIQYILFLVGLILVAVGIFLIQIK